MEESGKCFSGEKFLNETAVVSCYPLFSVLIDVELFLNHRTPTES